ERLAGAWRPVQQRRKHARAPATLYHDLDPIERTMRDEVDAETSRVVVDDRQALNAARAYCRRVMPAAENIIELYDGPGALFDSYGLEDEIATLIEPRVPLPSGGWITIEGTEALTAVDVNSGSYTEATGLEETSLRVNLEAAAEIGRQLRLRGIGGLVVIDFIHLNQPENIEHVLTVLHSSLAHDRTPTQISGMSEFGLVEITRKRTRDPLVKLMTECCTPCRASGRRRTAESIALEGVRQIERAGKAAPGACVIARAAPDVIRWIKRHEDEIRGGLARRGAARVEFEAGDELDRNRFDVSTR
ncbi:MAG: ribonuclease E/G, partial [Alphaproteobacteria bacterium]|nr:ribonuclease E/G [Alphaproteobacteria bacterium]